MKNLWNNECARVGMAFIVYMGLVTYLVITYMP